LLNVVDCVEHVRISLMSASFVSVSLWRCC